MSSIPEGEIRADEDGNVTMSVKTLKGLVGDVEDSGGDQAVSDKGREDYCCRNTRTGESDTIRASSTFSAILKCAVRRKGAPFSVRKGRCD